MPSCRQQRLALPWSTPPVTSSIRPLSRRSKRSSPTFISLLPSVSRSLNCAMSRESGNAVPLTYVGACRYRCLGAFRQQDAPGPGVVLADLGGLGTVVLVHGSTAAAAYASPVAAGWLAGYPPEARHQDSHDRCVRALRRGLVYVTVLIDAGDRPPRRPHPRPHRRRRRAVAARSSRGRDRMPRRLGSLRHADMRQMQEATAKPPRPAAGRNATSPRTRSWNSPRTSEAKPG